MRARDQLILVCAGTMAIQLASAAAQTSLARRAARHHASSRAAHEQVEQLLQAEAELVRQLKEVGDLELMRDPAGVTHDRRQIAAAQGEVDRSLHRYAELIADEIASPSHAQVESEAARRLTEQAAELNAALRDAIARGPGDESPRTRAELEGRFDRTIAALDQLVVRERGEMGEEDLLAAEAEALATTMAWVAPLLCGALMMAGLGLVLRSISRPLADLAEGATRVADGDLARPVPVRTQDELGTLARAFNEMQRALSARIAERDRALRDARFRELSEAAPVAIAELAADGRPLYTNQRWTELTGGADGCWTDLVHPDDAAAAAALVSGQSAELRLVCGERASWVSAGMAPLGGATGDRWILALADITPQKHATARAEEMGRELLTVSRRAGMAEVSAGVLHDVGNALHVVLGAAQSLKGQLEVTRVGNLVQATRMLDDHQADLAAFLATERGALVPPFLVQASAQLAQDLAASGDDLVRIEKGIEHIRAIISTQQSYARAAPAAEPLHLTEVIEDVLRMNAASFQRHEVRIVRRFEHDPELVSDRHRIMQVLLNLLGNARHALSGPGVAEPTIEIATRASGSGAVAVEVRDNGVGIPAENLVRIFEHGFTTRKEGHGFGLHSSAQAARQLGGRLDVSSPGRGHGATFILELPVHRQAASA